jgi:NADH dehydrogenase
MGLAKLGMSVMGTVGLPLGPDQYQGLRFENVPEDNDLDAFGVEPSELRTFRSYLGLDD